MKEILIVVSKDNFIIIREKKNLCDIERNFISTTTSGFYDFQKNISNAINNCNFMNNGGLIQK